MEEERTSRPFYPEYPYFNPYPYSTFYSSYGEYPMDYPYFRDEEEELTGEESNRDGSHHHGSHHHNSHHYWHHPCDCCAYIKEDPCMMNQQMQQPMQPMQQMMGCPGIMGQMNQPMGMGNPMGRDEGADSFDMGEDAYRDRRNHYWHHGYYPYMYNPYWYGYYPQHHDWHGYWGSHHHH